MEIDEKYSHIFAFEASELNPDISVAGGLGMYVKDFRIERVLVSSIDEVSSEFLVYVNIPESIHLFTIMAVFYVLDGVEIVHVHKGKEPETIDEDLLAEKIAEHTLLMYSQMFPDE